MARFWSFRFQSRAGAHGWSSNCDGVPVSAFLPAMAKTTTMTYCMSYKIRLHNRPSFLNICREAH